MTFELLTIKDFFSYFGNGYCVEMPLDKTKLNKLLNYLSAQEAVWKFYATLINGNWFHGIHITFQNEKHIKAETVMLHYAGKMGKPWRRKNIPQDYKEYMDKIPKSLRRYTFRDIRKRLFNKI